MIRIEMDANEMVELMRILRAYRFKQRDPSLDAACAMWMSKVSKAGQDYFSSIANSPRCNGGNR